MVSAATLVDTIGSAALSTIVESSQVSTHMSIDYLAPVKLGDTAVVDATVLQKGGRTGVIEVCAVYESYHCSSTFVMLPEQGACEHSRRRIH